MNDDQSSSSNGSGGRSWLERLGRAFANEPRSREDLIELLREVSARGLIESDTLAMIEGALEVDELQVRDVMVPRSHMVVIQNSLPLSEILPVIIESGHSRFPVVGEDRDEVQGILLAKDLLQLVANDSDVELADLVRAPVIIPESKRLNVLLREFRVSKNHMAIVVDEYGGVSGLVTIEDVLEEIVGDIDDEHDPDDDHDIQPDDKGGYIVRALTRLEDFNEHFAVDLPDEECDTIGGLVIHELGRMPRRGDAVELAGLSLRVLRADRRRVDTLHVTRLAADGG